MAGPSRQTLVSAVFLIAVAAVPLLAADDPENIIYDQLRSGDPQQRQAATDSLRQIVQASPHRVISDIQKWIKPLMEANLHAEILQITEQAIPLKAADAGITSDQQYARATALLALGEHERALAEAKSAYNVATQKHAGRAVALMIDVLKQARGEAVAKQFEQEQIKGMDPAFKAPADSVLASIAVDPAPHIKSIEQLRNTVSYERLLALGNLYLIADKPDEAMQMFLQAAATPGLKGKKLYVPLEGVARVQRVKSGGNGGGNATITAMKYGATGSPWIEMLFDLKLPVEQLQDSGRAIGLAKLPAPLQSAAVARGLGDEPKIALPARLMPAISVVQSAVPSDPELLAWLEKVNERGAIPENQIAELRSILDRTPLEIGALFALGSELYSATKDPLSASLVHATGARRAHLVLQEREPAAERRDILRLVMHFRDDFEPALWDRIDCCGDKAALEAAATLYEDFLRWCPDDDVELSRRRPLVRLTLANAYYMLREYDKQLRTIRQIDRGALNEGMRLLVGYSESLGLYEKGEYQAALPGFESCAAWEGFRARKAAKRYQIRSLASLGRSADAKAALREYVDQFSGNAHEAMTLSIEIVNHSADHSAKQQ
jgi:tetratricopeptide (TPR) repeat protein